MTQASLFDPVEIATPSFLEEVWNRITTEERKPEHTYIILPSVRAGLFYKNLYRQKAVKSVILPNITTIHSFIDNFSPYETLDSTTAIFELYSCYKQLCTETPEPFPEFYKWAKLLLNDFNEIDNYLIDAPHLFSNLQNLKELDDWSFNSEILSTNQQNFLGFWNQLLPLYQGFEKHLFTLGKAYSGKKVRWFARDIEQFIDNNPNVYLNFIGFNALNRAEETIIETLRSANMASVYWDIDPYYHQNPNQEAGKFFPKKDQSPNQHFIEGYMNSGELDITLISVPKSVGQVKVAANLLQHIPQHKLAKTAAVLANEALLSPLLNSFPDNIEQVNLTMGLPLKLNPLFSLIEALFEYNSFIKSNYIPVTALKKIIDHQYLSAVFQNNQALQEQLLKRRYIATEQVNDLCQSQQERVLFSNWNERVDLALASLQLVLTHLRELFSELGLSAMENEFLFETTKSIGHFSQLTKTYENLLDIGILKRLLLDELKKQKIAFIGEPILGLQVMGMLETRALDFENLFILGANEGTMPASPNESSLIPNDLKLHYGLPTNEKREAIYAYYVYRLLHRSKNVTFIYNNVVDELGGSEKSRFLLQLQEELPARNPKVKISEQKVWGQSNFGALKPLSVSKNPEILARLKNQLASGISPTALSTYLECPLNYFYRYVLGLNESSKTEEVSASEFGSLVHRILELAFDGMENKVLDEPFYKTVLEQLDVLANTALIDVLGTSKPEGKTLISLELAKHQFRKIIQVERDFAGELMQTGFHTTYLGSEKVMEYVTQLELDGEMIPIKIKGKIDRIHKTGNNVWVVDYKTGQVENRDLTIKTWDDLKKPKKRKALQLAVYGLAMQNQYSGLQLKTGIISTTQPTSEPMCLLLDKIPLTYTSEIAIEIEQIVHEIISDLLNPEIEFTHSNHAQFCPYC